MEIATGFDEPDRFFSDSCEGSKRDQARRNLSDADDDSDPMDFDNEVLDALAHLDCAPAAPANIKTFKSVTPSARSPPPAKKLGGFASDSDGVHTGCL